MWRRDRQEQLRLVVRAVHFHLHLHPVLRIHLWSRCLGRHGRDVPAQSPCEVPEYDDRFKRKFNHLDPKAEQRLTGSPAVALQLAPLFHHALPRGREPGQPRQQRLLDLGRLLLDRRRVRLFPCLRDQRSVPRAGAGALRELRQGVEERGLPGPAASVLRRGPGEEQEREVEC